MKQIFFLSAVTMAVSMATAAVETASPFADGMVLQRDMDVPVWGWADPGEKVTVSFAGKTSTAVASADGKWRVDLPPLKASKERQSVVCSTGFNAKPSAVATHRCMLLSTFAFWGKVDDGCGFLIPY